MQKLLQSLSGDLALAGISKSKLALNWGISPSGVTAVFKGERQMRFSHLTKCLALLNKGIKTESKYISKYVLGAKPKNRREIMEYLSLRGDFDTLKYLIEKEHIVEEGKKHTNALNEEWAQVYGWIHQRYTQKNVNLLEFYNSLREVNKTTKTKDMKLLIELLLCQLLYQMGDHKLASEKMHEISDSLNGIKNDFIKSTFDLRFKEAQAVMYIRDGKIIEARHICDVILSVCELNPFYIMPRAMAYFKKGETYLFTDYEKAKYYLSKAHDTLEEIEDFEGVKEKRNMFQFNLSFLKIIHMKEIETIGKIHDAERGLLEIVLGNNKAGEEILIGLKEKNGKLSDIQYVYLALARKDKTMMRRAYERLLQNNDAFYAQLAKMYLGKL
ncbi:AimR family lysis-lysogeny pheromone receptor [Bacillus mycoides]|uniref:AimR family lysis-lysogeny pheromone receptor n=1 Tax=Bacillus mycoides TaxID=1405 RepID=UPI003CF62F91